MPERVCDRREDSQGAPLFRFEKLPPIDGERDRIAINLRSYEALDVVAYRL
jgi:hypothetical protein